MSNGSIILKFIDSINRHDCARIASLISEDHEFIDAKNQILSRKKLVVLSWKKFFEMFPDYRIVVTELRELVSTVEVFGMATGTFNGTGKRFILFAEWKAVLKKNKIKIWQVNCDSTLIEETMR